MRFRDHRFRTVLVVKTILNRKDTKDTKKNTLLVFLCELHAFVVDVDLL